jgi:hypothetical protein
MAGFALRNREKDRQFVTISQIFLVTYLTITLAVRLRFVIVSLPEGLQIFGNLKAFHLVDFCKKVVVYTADTSQFV